MNNFVRGKWTFQKAIRINAIFCNSREKQEQGLLITNMTEDGIAGLGNVKHNLGFLLSFKLYGNSYNN